MGLVLVMGLAVPAAAGVSTDITGKVYGKVEYTEDGLSGKGKVETKIALSAGSEGAIKAVLDIGAWEANKEVDFGKGLSASEDLKLAVNSAYVETTGAWFKGAADTTTKIGRFEMNYNDWVAAISGSSEKKDNTDKDRGTQDGIEVAGIDLGGLSLAVANAWVKPEYQASVVSAAFSLDVVDVAAAVLSGRRTDVDESHLDFAVEATVTPVDGVSVTAEFAHDGKPEEDNNAYKVSGTLSTIDNLTLSASVWNTGAKFNPEFARWADGDDDGEEFDHATKFTTDNSGYEVKVNTTQSGIDLGLTYKNEAKANGDDDVQTTEVSAGTSLADTNLKGTVTIKSNEDNPKFVLEASRAFGGINGSYKLTREHDEKMTHEIAADTTVDTPVADGVKLEVKAKLLPEGSDPATELDADASWTAPNGIKLGLHYANYADGDFAEGFSARAEIEVTF